MDNFDLKKYLVENKVTTNSRILTENTDPSLMIVGDPEQMDRYSELFKVKTEDGKEEMYRYYESNDENYSDEEAFLKFTNDDQSKDLIMKADLAGNPDSPEYSNLRFQSLTYNKNN